MPTKKCLNCDSDYQVIAAKFERSNFCSKPCQYEYSKTRYQVPVEDRFWAKVIQNDGDQCWGWDGCTMPRGYPVLWERRNGKKMLRPGHRLSYEIHFGDIPKGMYVCHKCDNPTCTNPKHLFLGSSRDNALDMISKGRSHTVKLSPDDVRSIRRDNRFCRIIADEYGVDESTIAGIRRGATWRHI